MLRRALVDVAYFFIILFLVSYGLLLVLRGYVGLGLSRLRGSRAAS